MSAPKRRRQVGLVVALAILIFSPHTILAIVTYNPESLADIYGMMFCAVYIALIFAIVQELFDVLD